MGIRGTGIAAIFTAFIGSGAVFLAGCTGRAQAVFTKPELLTYDRLAVIGLNPENEQIFMAAYIKTFISRPVTFVERSRLAEIIGEQDLLQGRLDDRTRAKIKKILGVEALIMCDYYKNEDRPAAPMKLRVRIVDSETGAIVGSALTDTYSNFSQHAQAAVEALKADLLDGGYPRSYAPSPEMTPPSR
jgi:hypothetical protein